MEYKKQTTKINEQVKQKINMQLQRTEQWLPAGESWVKGELDKKDQLYSERWKQIAGDEHAAVCTRVKT